MHAFDCAMQPLNDGDFDRVEKAARGPIGILYLLNFAASEHTSSDSVTGQMQQKGNEHDPVEVGSATV